MNLPPKKNLAFLAAGWISALIFCAILIGNCSAQSAQPAPQSAVATPAPATNAAAQKEAADAEKHGLAERSKAAKQSAAEDAAFAKTKAGKICKKHPGWSRQTCEDVAVHAVRIGMTREQACEAWTGGWLRIGPRLANRTVTANGIYEQWVRSGPGDTPYGNAYGYLYFTNGILTSYQLAR